MTIKVGDKLPEAVLKEGAPDKDVKVSEVFGGVTGILVGVPGAFTPGCSKQHLPGYVSNYEKFKAAGASVIVVVAVNDAFVTGAWAEHYNAEGKVRVLADQDGSFAKALGLELAAAPMLGTNRLKRFSAVIKDNVVKSLNIEPDGTGLTCSLAEPLLAQLKDV